MRCSGGSRTEAIDGQRRIIIMKLVNDKPLVDDPDAPVFGAVRVIKPVAGDNEGPEAAERLHIEYSITRVVPGAWQWLQGRPGVARRDRSELAEAYRMLRNQVLFRMRTEGHKLLAVTSPRAIAGKSLTALNLALAIAADYDSSVLLIDADLSQRHLQRLFGLGDAPGLTEHLTLGARVSKLLVNPGVDRFVFLPAGRFSVEDSAELLATRTAQQLIQGMKERYQDRFIVVDLPPLLGRADALAFLPQADTTLVVVEENTTTVPDMQAAAELLAPFNLIGTVMSERAEPEAMVIDEDARPWYRRLLQRN
jgi:protein-tyrosine kinase